MYRVGWDKKGLGGGVWVRSPAGATSLENFTCLPACCCCWCLHWLLCSCLKLDFLFLLFLPPFILFFLIILFISVPPAPPDLLPYFSPPPRP